MFRTAGVTFENRQQILSDIYFSHGPYIECRLEKTIFENEPAIKVFETKTGNQIGWIPRESLDKLYNLNVRRIFGQIGYFNETWYAQLYNPVIVEEFRNKNRKTK